MHKTVKKAHVSRTIEESFRLLLHESQAHSLSIRTILKTLAGKGKHLILIFLILPFCLPLQIPGLSTPFGLLIVFLSLRIWIGKKTVWAPKFVLDKKVPHASLKKVMHKGLWLIKKIKPIVHPRLTWMGDHPVFHFINGLLLVLWGIFLALPLPIPFTNLIPGWIIFLMTLGLLEDDGLLILASYAMTILCALFVWDIIFPLAMRIL